jgi:transposase
MEALLTHVAGVDVHRDKLAITVLIGSPDEKPKVVQFESLTFTSDLEISGQKLLEMGVVHVALESTGIYWKPVFNIWHKLGIKITLANAMHVKNVPGRKTDINDSHWLAQLHRNGLIQASYIPEEKFQVLRSLNRHRKSLIRDCSTIKNRLLKVLEDGNCKLAGVISDVFGQTGLGILREIAAGNTGAEQLIQFVKNKNIKKSKEDIFKALTSCFRKDHVFLIKMLLSKYDYIQNEISSISKEVENTLEKYTTTIEKLKEIPGIEKKLAETIFIEATNNMNVFKSEKHFAAWAGVAPGNRESAGKKKRMGARKGNPALKEALVQAALGASKKKGTFFHAKHNALRFKLGAFNKATVAIANKLSRIIYHLIKEPAFKYKDIGPERVESRIEQAKKAIKKLQNMGYEINYSGLQLKTN